MEVGSRKSEVGKSVRSLKGKSFNQEVSYIEY